MTTLVNLINVREPKQEDLNFILDSFIHSLAQYTESMFKGWEAKSVFHHLEQVCLYALLHMKYTTLLAVNRYDDTDIMGYIIADPATNHVFFNYTKYAFRKLGVQKNMLLPLVTDPNTPISVSWQTKEMIKLQKAGKITIENKFILQLIERSL